jgi:hypothetical protein
MTVVGGFPSTSTLNRTGLPSAAGRGLRASCATPPVKKRSTFLNGVGKSLRPRDVDRRQECVDGHGMHAG